MAKEKKPEIPEAWTHLKHQEVETHGIGEGFALFEDLGQTLRGVLRTFFPTRHGKAVALQLTEAASVGVYRSKDDGTREKITTKIGDLVNLSLSGVDLERKLGPDLRDIEVGIQYSHSITTKAGDMKVYRVVVFQDELPF